MIYLLIIFGWVLAGIAFICIYNLAKWKVRK